MAVKVITDSTSCIPKDLAEKYGVEIVSLSVIMNGESYKEVDIDSEAFYDELAKCDKLPTSSQPPMDEFYNAFEKFAKDGHDIVAAFISSKLSGTYTTSHIIKDMILEKYPDVKIDLIDSQTSVMALGIGVLEGAKAAQEGKDFDEVSKIVRTTIEESEIIFVPGTLENLKKGGRIGKISAMAGTLLQIKPILTFASDGQLTSAEKVRGRKLALEKMAQKIEKLYSGNGAYNIAVANGGCIEEMNNLKDRILQSLSNPKLIFESEIDCTLASYVGPNLLGIGLQILPE